MNRTGRAAALVAAMLAMLVPAPAGATTAGAGYGRLVHYQQSPPWPVGYQAPATLDVVILRDGALGSDVLVNEVRIGPFSGTFTGCLAVSTGCGFYGGDADFPAAVPLSGSTVLGKAITGTCQDSRLSFSRFGVYPRLVAVPTEFIANCTATVTGLPPIVFGLEVGGLVPNLTADSFAGYYCTLPPFPSLVGCAEAAPRNRLWRPP